MDDWLARGFAGEMRYLHDPRRADLASVVPEARSVIVCALNYDALNYDALNCDAVHCDQPVPYSTEAAASGHQERGWISRYAWGDDYHHIVGDKLTGLLAALRSRYGDEFAARWYVDTGPISERAAAKVAGLGWVGKNTCLINDEVGSWLFLGVIITSLVPAVGPGEGPYEKASLAAAPDLCGNCRLCLDACPTGALVEPYVMDARRCISYLTIELRGTIPEEFRAGMGWQVFGCDICQDVCPWNRASVSGATSAMANIAAGTRDDAAEAFAPRAGLVAPELAWLLALSEADYRETFRGSPVKRAKWRGLIRNACIAAGNALRTQRTSQSATAQTTQRGAAENRANGAVEDSPLIPLLAKLAASDDAVIAEHARWALAQFESNAPVPHAGVRNA
jgi:epoxyqueuosine reductase